MSIIITTLSGYEFWKTWIVNDPQVGINVKHRYPWNFSLLDNEGRVGDNHISLHFVINSAKF